MRTRGTALLAPLVLLCLAVVPGPAAADTTSILPGCGICFPGGYDLNTVGEVRGSVSDLQVPEEGPVRFVVTNGADRWVVLASPTWFWERARPRLSPGDSVAVVGSKSLGADGVLYIVAREIRAEGAAVDLLLRDRRGRPLWRGGPPGGRRPAPGRR